MIDLIFLRHCAEQLDGIGYAEMTIAPKAVLTLIDQLEAAKLDAARWNEAKTGRYFAIIDGGGDEVRNKAADEAIDVFLAATKGEQA